MSYFALSWDAAQSEIEGPFRAFVVHLVMTSCQEDATVQRAVLQDDALVLEAWRYDLELTPGGASGCDTLRGPVSVSGMYFAHTDAPGPATLIVQDAARPECDAALEDQAP